MAEISAELLSCPHCDTGVLSRASAIWSCSNCRTQFPELDGIPWLFAEPQVSLGEWRERLHRLVLELEKDAQRVRAELESPALRTPTRSRLKLLAQAYADHARRLQSLLSPLKLTDKQATLETHLGLRTRLPPGQDLSSYYVNLHRDWMWGDQENTASLDLSADLLAGKPAGRMLILGAGAGRLACDLHRALKPELTVATDINPLLLLAAARIVRGETVPLYEFPIAPRRLEDHAILRPLKAPAPVDGTFHLVFADALHAPFRPESFDTIVTPWLIDIIAADFADLASRVNRLLRPGGRWLNFGSLAFSHREAALCYTLDEVVEVLGASGFACTRQREVTLPYMHSPASRHARLESVVAFTAEKTSAVPPPAPHSALPQWIATDTQPVPLLPQLRMTAAATRIYAFIMSLIDGQRSLRDIAQVLVDQKLMPLDEALPAVRSFLIRMHDDSRGL